MTSKTEKKESEPQEKPRRSKSAGPLPQETVVHLMKSGTEFLLAMDTILPKNIMPPEAKVHYKNIKKETLLLFRTIIDDQLKETEGKGEASAPRLRKIDLE
jgi:hypothetical protein